jgi:hypothetical protein
MNSLNLAYKPSQAQLLFSLTKMANRFVTNALVDLKSVIRKHERHAPDFGTYTNGFAIQKF